MGVRIKNLPARISVVINTLNEERNIVNAIQSVSKWAHEIVVVDMYSEDQTVKIAESLGAKVYYHERLGYADPAREFGVGQTRGNWILILDADEMIPEKLSKILMEIAEKDLCDVLSIGSYNYFSGEPLNYTGWGPDIDRHYRFYKKGYLRLASRVHTSSEPVQKARVSELPYSKDCAITHFNYINMEHFISKLNRYTSIEAGDMHSEDKIVPILTSLRLGIDEFFNRYENGEGHKDGWRGFYYSIFMSFYQLSKYGKLMELQEAGDGDAIRNRYQREADRIINEYNLF